MASLLNQLPASAVIRSAVTRKYLRYVQEAEPTAAAAADQPSVGGGAVGLISTQEPSILNPMSKIEVEEAKTDKKFVHLRFSHPNKYLARRGPGDDLNDRVIVATSNQPEEDRSKFSCTLFEPIIVNNTTGGGEGTTKRTGSRLVVKLRHVQSGGLLRVIPEHPHHLVVDNTNSFTTNETDFIFVDCNKLVISPRDLSFNIRNPVILKTTITTTETSTNTPLLKSEGGSTVQDPGLIITPVDKLITTKQVLNRRIFNVHFDLEYAQVYDVKTGKIETGSATNTSDKEIRATIKITYQDTTVVSLTNSQPIDAPVATDSTVMTAAFPRITDGGTVTIPSTVEETMGFGWNAATTIVETVEKSFEFGVPPRSRVHCNIVWKAANFTVPFTYAQRDEFSDGTAEANDYDDGSYTGFNHYDYEFVPQVEPL